MKLTALRTRVFALVVLVLAGKEKRVVGQDANPIASGSARGRIVLQLRAEPQAAGRG